MLCTPCLRGVFVLLVRMHFHKCQVPYTLRKLVFQGQISMKSHDMW